MKGGSMSRLLIIADDLTGSLDTGVQFAKKGIHTLVTVMGDRGAVLTNACQVLVVNTETRHIPPADAYERVSALVKQALDAGFDYIYKKTDSTLRGNIGSELAAVLEAAHKKEIVFVPAFPKSGRTTVRGIQYVDGKPLTETVFAADPFNPIRNSEVKAIIREQTDIFVENVFIDQLDTLSRPSGASPTIFVADCANDNDMQHIGEALQNSGKLKCLAGCAGFAELLPDLLGYKKAAQPVKLYGGHTLMVSGSLNPIAVKQVDYAVNACGYVPCTLSSDQLFSGNADADWEKNLVQILSENGKAAILTKRSEDPSADVIDPQKYGITEAQVPLLIANNIGIAVKRILDQDSIGTLIVFGGDTLLGIARNISDNLIMPICEIIPGVVLARFLNSRYPINIITKAGGYGEDNAAALIDEFLEKNKAKK